MPKVEIDTPGVTIRLEANEADIKTLGDQALQLYKDAIEADSAQASRLAFGFSNERRWTADARELGSHWQTMLPVHAEGGSHP